MLGWAVRQTMKKKLLPVKNAAKSRAASVKATVVRAKKCVWKAAIRSTRATRNAVLPILPGVSKLKLPRSPAPNLLLSNEAPNLDEVAPVRQVIAQVEAEKMVVRKKLALTDGTGYWETVTKHKIERMSVFIDQHKGVVSPLRRLPPEILQEIFLWVLPSKSVSRWMNNADVPWHLAQVSRSWRHFALSLPFLWNRLPTMDLAVTDPRPRTKLQVEYLSELIRRSSSIPLEVYIFSFGFSGLSHPVIDLLTEHSERWKVATIKMNTSSLPLLQRIKGRLTNLETLSIYLSGYEEGVPAIDMFAMAPRLRQVDVGGPFIADVTLPLPQLARYRDKIRMRNSITRVVTTANALQSLTILELCENPGTPPIPTVVLPYLKILQVKFCCTKPEFLNNLRIPLIEELKMVSYHDQGNLIPTLVWIIANSMTDSQEPCPLKVLRFRTHAVKEGQLASLLQLTPNLVALDMPLPPAADIALLASRQFHPTAHPHLRTSSSNTFSSGTDIEQPSIITPPPSISVLFNVSPINLAPALETCEFFINDVINSSHDRECSAALNVLANFRCENCEISSSSPTSVPSEGEPVQYTPPRRLKKLSLHFDRSRWIPAQQAALEGWLPTIGSEHLKTLKSWLHEEVPELDGGTRRRRLGIRKKKQIDKKWADRVRIVLSALEDLPIKDVREIQASEIHHSLKAFSQRKFPTDRKDRFPERARALLESWEPLFKENLAKCKWVMSGDHSMVYVPRDDDVRHTSDALNSLVYGLQDSTSYRSAFWPIYMNS